MGSAFVEVLPVGKFHGIGPATSTKMNALGLYSDLDMRSQSLEFMCPRGSSTWRIRNQPVSQNLSCRSCADQPFEPATPTHGNAGSRNQTHFGKAGSYYDWISRGVDNREVRADRIRKPVGAENTFSTDFDAMVVELEPLIDKVWRYCEGAGNRGRTVTLKMKFNDF
jgi:DNA polymerase-4